MLIPSCRVSFAKSFLANFKTFRKGHIRRSQEATRVKIAVLDTGLDAGDPGIRALQQKIRCDFRSREIEKNKSPIRGTKNFTENSDIDIEGHGTNVVRILLTVCPEADLYVGKISHTMATDVTDRKILEASAIVICYGMSLTNITKAFRWAVNDIGADIVSMSFGFDVCPAWKSEMDEAIRKAYMENRLIFAAASNYGANRERTYPANSANVFCIHATDGNGNKSGMDPIPLDWCHNFSTLGVAVPCGFKDGHEMFLSGSSYSTPIAVGIATNILQHAKALQRENVLTQGQLERLHNHDGMKSVFHRMACRSDSYDYLAPWNLWYETANSDLVWQNIKLSLGDS